MKRKKLLFLSVLFILFLTSCSPFQSKTNESSSTQKSVETTTRGIKFDTSSIDLYVNDSKQLNVVSLSSFNVINDENLELVSSDSSVVLLTKGHIAWGLKQGTAIVTATYGDYYANCVVHVIDSKPSNSTTQLTPSSSKIVTPSTTTPSSSKVVTPSTTTPSSSKVVMPSTTTPSSSKVVTPSTTTPSSSKVVASSTTATSSNIACTSLKLSETTKELKYGETFKLSATKTPSNATDKVEWSTSNSNVASVSSTGTVKGLGIGTAEITAKCGGKTATCTVTVVVNCEGLALVLSNNPKIQGESYVQQVAISNNTGAKVVDIPTIQISIVDKTNNTIAKGIFSVHYQINNKETLYWNLEFASKTYVSSFFRTTRTLEDIYIGSGFKMDFDYV